MSAFLQRFKMRYNIQESENTSEILQNPVQRNDEANQSNNEKFIQEFNQLLETENIKGDNIYIRIKTDVIWKTLIQILLEHVHEKEIAMQIDVNNLKKNQTCCILLILLVVTNYHLLFLRMNMKIKECQKITKTDYSSLNYKKIL